MRPAPKTPRRERVIHDTHTARAVYLPYPLWLEVREYADRWGVATSVGVRHLLRAGLEKVDKPPPRGPLWEQS